MKPKSFHIETYVHIKNNRVYMDGELKFQSEESNFSNFIKGVYKYFNTDYPKFFKMDNLSKLAFLSSDLILKEQESNIDIALVFSNKASSLDTDRKHEASIKLKEAYFPSPSVFVYTLPNICIGEISIRHKLHSENSFFIFNRFNAPHLYHYSEALLKSEKTEKTLCGWVELDGDKYEAFVYLVSDEGSHHHSIDNIENLYNTQ